MSPAAGGIAKLATLARTDCWRLHMGQVGRWIDERTDIERDRIIEAQGWVAGYLEYQGQRCLVGHVCGTPGWRDIDFRDIAVTATRFDQLVLRFGLDRIVRACKLRAARGGIVTPELTCQRCKNERVVDRDVSGEDGTHAELFPCPDCSVCGDCFGTTRGSYPTCGCGVKAAQS